MLKEKQMACAARGMHFFDIKMLRVLLFGVLAAVLLQGCMSTDPGQKMPDAMGKDKTMPSPGVMKGELGAAYLNARNQGSYAGRPALCTPANIGSALKQHEQFSCLPPAKPNDRRSYFNQPTTFRLACPSKAAVEESLESNIVAVFGSESAHITINAPRAHERFPDTITIRNMLVARNRTDASQNKNTSVTFRRAHQQWQHSLGGIKQVNVSTGFSQLHYIRQDSPDRKWKFDEVYAEVSVAGSLCSMKVIIGNKLSQPL